MVKYLKFIKDVAFFGAMVDAIVFFWCYFIKVYEPLQLFFLCFVLNGIGYFLSERLIKIEESKNGRKNGRP